MTEINYAPIPKKTRGEILRALAGEDHKEISAALMSAAYWDTDWKWAEDQLVRFAFHGDPQVLWSVASGFGLLAAFHGELDLNAAEPILERLRRNALVPGLSDAAANSLEEIEHFVKRRRAGEDVPLADRMPPEWRPA